MSLITLLNKTLYQRQTNFTYKSNWQRLHLDPFLLVSLFIMLCIGLLILYSATNQNISMMFRQSIRIGLATLILFVCAQIPPDKYKRGALVFFIVSFILVLAVLLIGKMGKGAQRWLDFGLIKFQPSELLKLSVPLTVAWYLSEKSAPPSKINLLVAFVITLIPSIFVAKQPDLGTAVIIMCAGCSVILMAGISWPLLAGLMTAMLSALPLLWHFMHEYQRQRLLTFINPELDPLGSGYHIIQSKIAIGSGGLLGKGWLNGSQSHLHFLPEHATDFIFAVIGEELGILGCLLIIILYLIITRRILSIATSAKDQFTRLLAGSLGLTFIISCFVNMSMVTGLLPVVGLPLPFISYGGTSLVTQMASFGIIMSIHSHRKLLRT